MNVLVTGGAGYIGSHAAKTLSKNGHNPVVLDNLSTGHTWAVKWGPLIEGDIGNQKLVYDTLTRHRIDVVMHFAANAYVGESIQDPQKYFRNNVVNALALLDAMLKAHVFRMVFSSSCATYGTPQLLPLTESHPQCPINPYGESKLFIEKALHWYGLTYGLRSVVLRYFNAAGADPDCDIGEFHDPETHLIPLVLAVAAGEEPSIAVYGTDYDTPDGTAIRDYIHVTDLAQAHTLSADYLLTGNASSIFNLGTGHGYSVREVIEAARRVTGCDVPLREAPRRPGDPAALVAHAAKAAADLHWSPKYTRLDTILDTAWHWRQSGLPAAIAANAI